VGLIIAAVAGALLLVSAGVAVCFILLARAEVADIPAAVANLAGVANLDQDNAGGERAEANHAAADPPAEAILQDGGPIVLKGYAKPVLFVAFSEDDKTLVTASSNGLVRTWDVSPPKLRTTTRMRVPPDEICSFAIFPEATVIAAASRSGRIVLCDLTTGEAKTALTHTSGEAMKTECPAVFSPDGKLLASVHDRTRVWSVSEQELRWTAAPLAQARPVGIAFSPDGKTLVVQNSLNTVQVYEANTGKELATLKGLARGMRNQVGVGAMAFSRDGKTFAAGGDHLALRFWDVDAGEERAVFETVWPTTLAFSKDSRFLAAGNRDGGVHLLEVLTGAETVLRGGLPAHALAFSTGQGLLAVAVKEHVELWEIAKVKLKAPEVVAESVRVTAAPQGQSLRLPGARQIVALAFADKSLHAVGNDGKVRVLETTTPKLEKVIPLQTGIDWLNSLSSSNNLGAGSSQFGRAYVFDLARGKRLAKFEHLDIPVNAYAPAAVSPDGTRLATAHGDKSVKIWNLVTGKVESTLEGHAQEVNSVAFSPDNKTLAASGANHTLRLWDIEQGTERAVLRHINLPVAAAFSRDGKLLATAEPGTIHLWSVERGSELAQAPAGPNPNQPRALTFAPDHKTLAFALGNEIQLWQLGKLNRNNLQKTPPDPQGGRLITHKKEIKHIVFAPDNRTVITAGSDREIKLADVTTGRVVETFSGLGPLALTGDGKTLVFWEDGKFRLRNLVNGKLHPAFIEHRQIPTGQELALSADGSLGLVADGGKGLKLFRLPSCELIRQWPAFEQSVTQVAFSPDGKIFAVYIEFSKRPLRLFDTASGKERTSCDISDLRFNRALVFSADGKRLFTAGEGGGVPRTWDTENGRLLATQATGQRVLSSLAAHPGGQILACGGERGTVILWDLKSNRKIVELSGRPNHARALPLVAFAPDGRTLVAANHVFITVWDASMWSSAATFP
jgi:WD40 repeat protein